MRIFVAGGGGYIGSVLVPSLLAAGHHVTVLDRFFFGFRLAAHPNLVVQKADIRTFDGALLRGMDAVIDLAGISNDPSCELEPGLTQSVNVDGAKRLIDLAREASVPRYVYSSSCSVYGHGEGLGLAETAARHPVSLYARAKAEIEDYLLGKNSVKEPVILRLATVFGLSPRMRFDLAVNVMTKNAYVQRRITVDGGGRQWRPFVHVSDVADAFSLAVTASSERAAGKIFNVGSTENNVQILNLAFRVRDAIGNTEVVHAPTDPDLRDYNVAFDRVRQELDFNARFSIDDGIREVHDALKKGTVDPDERRFYTLKQYLFLREAERAFSDLSIAGRLLEARA